MEKLNKHGLPIMNVVIKKKKVDNDYFCHGLDNIKCYRVAKHKHGDYDYCEKCYLIILEIDREYDEL